VVTATPSTPLAAAWALLQEHRLHALPVLEHGRVVGIVAHVDFLRYAGLDGESPRLAARLRGLAARLRHGSSEETVGRIMSTPVTTIGVDEPLVELVPLMSNLGRHRVPVVDAHGQLVGLVSQTDLLAALYENQLSVA
jgi:CBS domain-containing membrane protein